MTDYVNEIRRRRTLAIISYPDAGKTMLTEKLLPYGGAVLSVGSIKGKKADKHTASDRMEIEKQRDIFIISSVLRFEYNDFCINILDTPGRQDLSEGTYRTLMAADSAVVVIDASKGAEAQTKKLFKVCLLRKIPVFTSINKMDRAAMNPFELLEHIESGLGIATYAMNWSIGSGKEFKGVYERDHHHTIAFHGGDHGQKAAEVSKGTLEGETFRGVLGDHSFEQLREDSELLGTASTEFDQEPILKGELMPVFSGSALTNFDAEPFPFHFLDMTTSSLPRESSQGEIDPMDERSSIFVFKVQASAGKAHRSRIAFTRICSGRFEKGMEVMYTQQNRKIEPSQPQQLAAQDHETVKEVYTGDMIGVLDPGIFSTGDTLRDPSMKFEFKKIPISAPEYFARVTQKDTMKRKQLTKGIVQVVQEGAIQVFQEVNIGMGEIIVGGVGVLQSEVLEQRLKSEYNVDIKPEILPSQCARWIDDQALDPDTLNLTNDFKRVRDLEGRNLIIFMNDRGIKWALEQNKGLTLSDVGTAEQLQHT